MEMVVNATEQDLLMFRNKEVMEAVKSFPIEEKLAVVALAKTITAIPGLTEERRAEMAKAAMGIINSRPAWETAESLFLALEEGFAKIAREEQGGRQ